MFRHLPKKKTLYHGAYLKLPKLIRSREKPVVPFFALLLQDKNDVILTSTLQPSLFRNLAAALLVTSFCHNLTPTIATTSYSTKNADLSCHILTTGKGIQWEVFKKD